MTSETEASIALHGGAARQLSLRWCAACGRQVEMVTPECAAQLAGVSRRAIYAGVESGKVHFLEIPESLLLVCVHSLASLEASLDR